MNIIKIIIFICYGFVLKFYDDCVDNPHFRKYISEFYLEQFKSLIIFFLVFTGIYEPYYAIVKFILLLLVMKDVDNPFWISYLLCSFMLCAIGFHKLTYDFTTILLVASQIPVTLIDITYFSEDSSYKKYIWRSILGIIYSIYLIIAYTLPAYYNEFFVYYCISVLAYGITMICTRIFIYIKTQPTTVKKTKKIKSKSPKNTLVQKNTQVLKTTTHIQQKKHFI